VKQLLCLLCLLCFPLVVWAQFSSCGTDCLEADTCSQANVAATVTAADAGDTVQIPAGSCTWSDPVVVTKALNIIGAGQGVTIITQNGQSDGTWDLDQASGTLSLGEMTINGTIGGFNGSIQSIKQDNTRVHHMTFDFSTDRHAIRVNGNRSNVLIDNCIFTGSTRGVNIFASSAYWTTAAEYDPGTSKGVYIEESTFNRSGVEVVDLNAGGAYVFRHNDVPNGGNVIIHGADSGDRSGGYAEIYNNTFDNPGATRDFPMNFRGGSQIIYNNTITGPFNQPIKTQNYRSCYTENTGLSFHANNQNDCEHDSVNVLDGDESPEDNGWPCKDQIGRGPNQSSKPSYEWDNTHNGGNANFNVNNLGGCSNPSTNDHIQSGRDYFTDTEMPGYTAYTYPHPLQGEPPEDPPAPSSPMLEGVQLQGGRLP
jgi:hypothetical protein